jgi:hypothetical protein
MTFEVNSVPLPETVMPGLQWWRFRLQGLQALGVGQVHPAMRCLPVIQRRLADPVLAGRIARLRSRLVLTQHRDDLIFRKPLPLHLSALQSRPDSNSK